MNTLVWVGLTLMAWPAARAVQHRFSDRTAAWEPELGFWARAAFGVLPLYGAWVTGAVIGRECGLSGFSPAAWLRGTVLCGLLLGALALSLRSAPMRHWLETWYGPQRSWLVLLDEPRWAFYRGAGAVAFPATFASQLAGWILGVVEWLAHYGVPTRATPTHIWSNLVRLGVSAALFALTHNLWLVIATQAAAQALLIRPWAKAPPAA